MVSLLDSSPSVHPTIMNLQITTVENVFSEIKHKTS